MGVVYKARDMHLDRFVGKVTAAGRGSTEPTIRRFVQEAKTASALNHPNIVHIYDIANDGEIDYIAMELVDGKTLADLITLRGLRTEQVLKYGAQVAEALAKSHAAGIIHRDLKPTNIMVTEAGLIKVLDFGLAKLVEGSGDEFAPTRTVRADEIHTEAGAVVGTLAYMSPEQAQGKPVDGRSDIFSLGAVLYEMAAGRSPFWARLASGHIGADSSRPACASAAGDSSGPAKRNRTLPGEGTGGALPACDRSAGCIGSDS